MDFSGLAFGVSFANVNDRHGTLRGVIGRSVQHIRAMQPTICARSSDNMAKVAVRLKRLARRKIRRRIVLQRGQDLVEVHGSTGPIISLTPGPPNSTVRSVDWPRNSPPLRRRIAQHLDYARDLEFDAKKRRTSRVSRKRQPRRPAAAKQSGFRANLMTRPTQRIRPGPRPFYVAPKRETSVSLMSCVFSNQQVACFQCRHAFRIPQAAPSKPKSTIPRPL